MDEQGNMVSFCKHTHTHTHTSSSLPAEPFRTRVSTQRRCSRAQLMWCCCGVTALVPSGGRSGDAPEWRHDHNIHLGRLVLLLLLFAAPRVVLWMHAVFIPTQQRSSRSLINGGIPSACLICWLLCTPDTYEQTALGSVGGTLV